MQKKNLPAYIFVFCGLLIVVAAILYIWSDYTTNGQLGRNLELASKITIGAAIVGLIINIVRR